jgi:DNA-binding MarR family transcriptional regulator
MTEPLNDESGGRASPSIDRLVHEPARLALMSLLYVVEAADFVFLQGQTGLTGGNVSSHMSKLEEAGYVEVEKSFVGKRPQTVFRLTGPGRAAFRRYRDTMKGLLDPLPD